MRLSNKIFSSICFANALFIASIIQKEQGGWLLFLYILLVGNIFVGINEVTEKNP